MSVPIGTLLFSGFGDSLMQFTDADGNAVTPPTGARIGDTTAFGGTNGCTGFVSLSNTRYFVVGTSYNEPPDQIVEAVLDENFLGYAVSVPNSAPPYITQGGTGGAAVDGSGNGYWLAGSFAVPATIRKTNALGFAAIVGNIGGTDSYSNGMIGVNQAGTIAYYAKDGLVSTVKRWDLSGDIAMSDFVTVTGGSGHKLGGILVLPDDTVILGWDAATSAGGAVRYNADGSTATTYTLPDTYDIATWIAAAVDLTTGNLVSDRFFIAYYSAAAGYGLTVAQVSTVSGTVLTDFAAPSDGFEWDGPFTVARGGSQPVPPTPFPPGEGTVYPMRKLRRSPTYSTEKLQNFFTRFQLDFQAGGPREGRDPIAICLRYSDDSGNTWSDEIWMDVDAFGAYDSMAVWFQLGQGRDRVWEVSSTSTAMTVWLAAYLDILPGTHV